SPRLNGAGRSPCRQSLSISIASDRFNPRMAAKEMATQRVPGAINALSRLLGSKAKLKITRTRTPNIVVELSDSLLRISMTISLKTIAATGFIAALPSGRTGRTLRGYLGLSHHRRTQSFRDR